jgi:hypothetical protein
MHQLHHHNAAQMKELNEELECYSTEASICNFETEFWQEQFTELHKKYQWLVKSKDVPLPKDKDRQVGSKTTTKAPLDCGDQPESLSNASVGITTHADMCPFPMNGPVPSYICKRIPEIACIAAARDEALRE